MFYCLVPMLTKGEEGMVEMLAVMRGLTVWGMMTPARSLRRATYSKPCTSINSLHLCNNPMA